MATIIYLRQSAQQYFTLYIYINYFRQQNISIKYPPFHYLKKLVLYNFNVRIIILFLMHICNRLNIYKEGTVKKYIISLIPKQFL